MLFANPNGDNCATPSLDSATIVWLLHERSGLVLSFFSCCSNSRCQIRLSVENSPCRCHSCGLFFGDILGWSISRLEEVIVVIEEEMCRSTVTIAMNKFTVNAAMMNRNQTPDRFQTGTGLRLEPLVRLRSLVCGSMISRSFAPNRRPSRIRKIMKNEKNAFHCFLARVNFHSFYLALSSALQFTLDYNASVALDSL